MSKYVLQFQRDADRLLVSLLHDGQRTDAVPFEDAALLETWSGEFNNIVEQALTFPLNDHRSVFVEFGRCLFDNLLDGPLADELRDLEPSTIVVDLPESLLWLPVEVMHDGIDFLGVRHALGRRITSWAHGGAQRGKARMDGVDKPAFLLIGGHAEDDLFFDETRDEIYRLCARLEETDSFEMRELMVDNSLPKSDVMRALSAADFIHFSGHSDGAAQGKAGWVFEDFRLGPDDLLKLTGCDPFFVFSNSCRSSSITNWSQVRDLVRTFWDRGTQHFIGANTRVHYKHAAEFAEAFYQKFLSGSTIGKSVQHARQTVLSNPTHHDPCWISYVLYGDPSFRIRDLAPEPVGASSSPTIEKAVGGQVSSAPTNRPGYTMCGWSGAEIPIATAKSCAHPGCLAKIGMAGQLAQKRARLDMALHGGSLSVGSSAMTGEVWCRDHVPDDLRQWMEKGSSATQLTTANKASCAWTGHAASRSDLLDGTFRETEFGLMSPGAQQRFICAATGEIIPPDQARKGRGWIRHQGKTLTEVPYWERLGIAKLSKVSRAEADHAEEHSRLNLKNRLDALSDLELGGRSYSGVELHADEPADTVWTATLRSPGGLLRGGLALGVRQYRVWHDDHMKAFDGDRQPAGVADLEKIGQQVQPVPDTSETLVLLSSPTGWTSDAREQVRQLAPANGLTLVLKSVSRGLEPLAFHPDARAVDVLKLELSGGLSAV